jgi:hypothetical protein
MHDVMMMHKTNKDKKNLIGVFSGSSQHATPQRNRAPRFLEKKKGMENSDCR